MRLHCCHTCCLHPYRFLSNCPAAIAARSPPTPALGRPLCLPYVLAVRQLLTHSSLLCTLLRCIYVFSCLCPQRPPTLESALPAYWPSVTGVCVWMRQADNPAAGEVGRQCGGKRHTSRPCYTAALASPRHGGPRQLLPLWTCCLVPQASRPWNGSLCGAAGEVGRQCGGQRHPSRPCYTAALASPRHGGPRQLLPRRLAGTASCAASTLPSAARFLRQHGWPFCCSMADLSAAQLHEAAYAARSAPGFGAGGTTVGNAGSMACRGSFCRCFLEAGSSLPWAAGGLPPPALAPHLLLPHPASSDASCPAFSTFRWRRQPALASPGGVYKFPLIPRVVLVARALAVEYSPTALTYCHPRGQRSALCLVPYICTSALRRLAELRPKRPSIEPVRPNTALICKLPELDRLHLLRVALQLRVTQQAKLVLAPVAAQQQQQGGCGIEAVAASRPKKP